MLEKLSRPEKLQEEEQIMNLNPQLLQKFEEDGFLVLKEFVTVQECKALISEAMRLVKTYHPQGTFSVFSTTSPQERRDAYFLESGDKIHFFWEKEALDQEGRPLLPPEVAFNKIGHALHDLNPVFREFSRSAKVENLIKGTMGLKDPLLLQSMYIFKNPRVGGEVVWHQDQSYLDTNPGNVLGLWVALEDATVSNGCLWAMPGEHKKGLKQRFCRKGSTTSMETLDGSDNDPGSWWDESKKIPLEVPQGAVILLHGLLPHKSETNHSPLSRHAYTLHFMDRSWKYSAKNWLQRGPDSPFSGFEVRS